MPPKELPAGPDLIWRTTSKTKKLRKTKNKKTIILE